MENKDNKNKINLPAVIIGTLLGVFIFMGMQRMSPQDLNDPKQFYLKAIEEAEVVPYLEFEEILNSGTIDDVYYCQTNEKMVYTVYNEDSKKAEAEDKEYVYDMKDTYVTDYPANTDFRLNILQKGVSLTRVILDDGNTLLQLFLNFLPVLMTSALLFWWIKNMNMVSKVEEKDIMETSNITFDDIIGLDETKEELNIVVNLIKNTISGEDIGAKVPHGILLSGPPGVGKTLIAKAISNAAGVPFINMSGSDFQEIYVGSGAKRVRELFSIARRKAPCIIFIDEFDAIGTSRASSAANSEDRKTINALLKELDGFKPLEKVFILAATNYPEHLDKAVTRSGRFDREIAIQPPRDWQARADLFNFYLRDKKVADDVDVETISKTLTGYTGADIATICNEAALVALGKGMQVIDKECMETAIDKKIFKGNYTKKKVNVEDLTIVAYHESGHAIASILLGDKVSRASIKSTTSGVGGVVFGSDSDSQFMTKKGLINKVKIAYAGRASEEIFMKDITTGASNDIAQATEYLQRYVDSIGFDEHSGLLNMAIIDHKTSETKKTRMQELSKQFYREIKELLEENKGMVESLAQELLRRETMTGKEIEAFFASQKSIEVKEDLTEV